MPPYTRLDDERNHLVDEEQESRAACRPKKRKRWMIGVACAVVIVGLGTMALLRETGSHKHHADTPTPEGRVCRVMCDSALLRVVQMSKLFNDSKEFVDMPLREDPETVLKEFHAQFGDGINPPRDKLLEFVHAYFAEAGSDIAKATPPDFSNHPPVAAKQRNASLAEWARDVNAIWRDLYREIHPSVFDDPARHTLIRLPHPFVLPGGRFRETYYWDTYFILLGLLESGMHTTAQGMVLNLVYEVNQFGLVPNGGRAYFLGRSQPPLLSEMVRVVANATRNGTLIEEALPALEKEYSFWMQTGSGGRAVALPDPDNEDQQVFLNRYNVHATYPRPESFVEDVETALGAGLYPYGRSANPLYGEIATMAETGWDFSTRWLSNASSLASAYASRILPVDLNTILYRMEQNLARFAAEVRGTDHVSAQAYAAAADKRARAIRRYLWRPDLHHWSDWVMSDHDADGRRGSRGGAFSNSSAVSNFVPLWAAGLRPQQSSEQEAVVNALLDSGLLQPGGLLTTLEDSGQQWDSPNAWAPLNHLLIDALRETHTGKDVARELARRWLRSNLIAYQRTGFMFEKYDALVPGSGGGGGEYVPQRGFGWTNGVALRLLAVFEFDNLETA